MESKLVILSLTLALAASLAAVYCLADDAFERRERHGKSKDDDHERKGKKHGTNGRTPSAADSAYAAVRASAAPCPSPVRRTRRPLQRKAQNYAAQKEVSFK